MHFVVIVLYKITLAKMRLYLQHCTMTQSIIVIHQVLTKASKSTGHIVIRQTAMSGCLEFCFPKAVCPWKTEWAAKPTQMFAVI